MGKFCYAKGWASHIVFDSWTWLGFYRKETMRIMKLLWVTLQKDQKQYWARKDEPYSFVTVKEFTEAFLLYHVGRRVGD